MIRLIWIHQLFSFLVICLFDNRIIWEYVFQLSLQIFQTFNSNSSVVFFLVVPLTTWFFFFDRIVKYFFDFFGFRCEKSVNCKEIELTRWEVLWMKRICLIYWWRSGEKKLCSNRIANLSGRKEKKRFQWSLSMKKEKNICKMSIWLTYLQFRWKQDE
jgi:hypothetical protein